MIPVDVTSLFRDLTLFIDILANDIFFVELTCPPLRDSVLHLILNGALVWTLGQGSCQRLIMKLVKLVIELSDHVLNVLTLLFRVELLEDCTLYV